MVFSGSNSHSHLSQDVSGPLVNSYRLHGTVMCVEQGESEGTLSKPLGWAKWGLLSKVQCRWMEKAAYCSYPKCAFSGHPKLNCFAVGFLLKPTTKVYPQKRQAHLQFFQLAAAFAVISKTSCFCLPAGGLLETAPFASLDPIRFQHPPTTASWTVAGTWDRDKKHISLGVLVIGHIYFHLPKNMFCLPLLV